MSVRRSRASPQRIADLNLLSQGLWIVAHECGHQAFSESKTINNAVGWVLHSICGVPYHSWRISHGRHHAATGHIHRDEVFVPRTRDQLGLPKLDEAKEDVEGFNVTAERQKELAEAIGDAPLFVLVNLIVQQVRQVIFSSDGCSTAADVASSRSSSAGRCTSPGTRAASSTTRRGRTTSRPRL